ncbi:MAG: HupE/UreJ family protein [Burkholderiaceae bacterium]
MKTSISKLIWTSLIVLGLGLLSNLTRAHEIPSDVRIQAFIKPSGQSLQLLLRVPLGAMRETDFPLRGPGYLQLENLESALQQAAQLWLSDNIQLRENDQTLAKPKASHLRVSLPSDKSFTEFDSALSHVQRRDPPTQQDLFWNQQFLDVLYVYPIQSEKSKFTIHFQFDRLGLQVVSSLRFLPSGGSERAFQLHGDAGPVSLDPSWLQASTRFLSSGFKHILSGTDHLLFLVCLVLPWMNWVQLILIITSFTLAHSITLGAAAFGLFPTGLWFAPLIEFLIAASIVYMALENIIRPGLKARWAVTFFFGLIHGFGFSFALRDSLQFAGSHLLSSLLAFNLGVEAGQLVTLLALVPLIRWSMRYVERRMLVIVCSALVTHTSIHWLIERGEILAKFFPTSFIF